MRRTSYEVESDIRDILEEEYKKMGVTPINDEVYLLEDKYGTRLDVLAKNANSEYEYQEIMDEIRVIAKAYAESEKTNMIKKYEVTEQCYRHNGLWVWRIRALKDFADVKKGDLGGYVQSEHNLSQVGTSWIYDNSMVYDNALVGGNGIIKESSIACDDIIIHSGGVVCNGAVVRGKGSIDHCTVSQNMIGGE